MSRSCHTPGRSALGMPTKSIRWPPVILTRGTLYFTATWAIRISSAGVQTPPAISGTTEKVPSFWMLACTRSLMKRASRSSSYSPAQTVAKRLASGGLLAASSPWGDSAANTAETERKPCSLILATSSGFASGMVGT